jgi:hypothetical protein
VGESQREVEIWKDRECGKKEDRKREKAGESQREGENGKRGKKERDRDVRKDIIVRREWES